MDYEKLGLFYLGRPYDLDAQQPRDGLVLYDSRDLVTHAVCVGMTGSGKTGLCLALIEEAAIDGIPALLIDPKGDLGNLLLTFPDLGPADFRPWINDDDARRTGMDADAFAAEEAAKWKHGLAAWGQDGARVRRLHDAADMAIYTPGSQAGIPVSVLKSFDAPPPAVLDDADLLRERVSTTASSLLGLAGIGADPVRSREHILLATLLDGAWRQGRSLDVGELIQQIQTPPISRVGVLELESFYPAGERFGLATALNNLLAAPGFAAWLEGEPLDVQRLLYTASGRPRLAIFSIAHLSDAERMFFVSLLLTQVLGWTRTLSGTTSLRAIVYMDEIFGYLPPSANPPSKVPMLTLLKQARAFGVGMVLATQNPVDLDYKALSNAGTWFIGRLQTERDQMRVLDGLAGAQEGGGLPDRQALGRTLAALGSRVFLMHNVHDRRPEVFESRWALSYLRGPLTRAQIKTLMDAHGREREPVASDASDHAADRRARPAGATPGAAPGNAGAHLPPGAAAPASTASSSSAAGAWGRPVLPPEIPQFFAPALGPALLVPMLLGAAHVRFADRKRQIDETRRVAVLTRVGTDAMPVDWTTAIDAPFDIGHLSTEPPPGATFATLPPLAVRPRQYAEWTRSFVAWLTREEALELWHSPAARLVSRPGETEGDFRVRVQQAAREARDARTARLREKYAARAAALQERLRRAQQSVAREQEQAASSRVQTGISFATTVLGAILGHKAVSASTLGRATTAARGVGRSMKESQDVARAQENAAAVEAQLKELDASLAAEIQELEAARNPAGESLESLVLKPKRGDVHVDLVGLVWVARQE